MKFMVQTLTPLGPPPEGIVLKSPEQMSRVRHHQKALVDLVAERGLVGGATFVVVSVGMGAATESAIVRNSAGHHLTLDGPFAETKELLAGFDIIDFASREDAIAFAKNEHLAFDHTMIVWPIEEMWWINTFRDYSNTTLFMLSMFAKENAMQPEGDRGRVARQVQRVGAEYMQQRAFIENKTIAWAGARLRPSEEAAFLRFAQGSIVDEKMPLGAGGEAMTGFCFIACESMDAAKAWARKLAIRENDAIEVRTVNGFWWTYHDEEKR